MKRRGQESPVPEESTKETVKTNRVRECRVNRRDRGDLLACFFHLHARLRVRLAPGIPHALFGRETYVDNPGAVCRGDAESCRDVIARSESDLPAVALAKAEAIQTSSASSFRGASVTSEPGSHFFA